MTWRDVLFAVEPWAVSEFGQPKTIPASLIILDCRVQDPAGPHVRKGLEWHVLAETRADRMQWGSRGGEGMGEDTRPGSSLFPQWVLEPMLDLDWNGNLLIWEQCLYLNRRIQLHSISTEQSSLEAVTSKVSGCIWGPHYRSKEFLSFWQSLVGMAMPWFCPPGTSVCSVGMFSALWNTGMFQPLLESKTGFKVCFWWDGLPTPGSLRPLVSYFLLHIWIYGHKIGTVLEFEILASPLIAIIAITDGNGNIKQIFLSTQIQKQIRLL